ncbi:DUF5335 domain-containing protein [Caldovatus aquaticus]|nr:DUF5335 domain-containing protein [Caldovatus aquaticus]
MTMRSRKLERSEWKPYSDRVSKALVGKRAEVEVVSLDLGHQVQAEWLPIYGITFDPKDNLFEIALEGLDHLIRAPQEVYVLEGPEGLESVEIVDADGRRQIVRLKEPLALPPPEKA